MQVLPTADTPRRRDGYTRLVCVSSGPLSSAPLTNQMHRGMCPAKGVDYDVGSRQELDSTITRLKSLLAKEVSTMPYGVAWLNRPLALPILMTFIYITDGYILFFLSDNDTEQLCQLFFSRKKEKQNVQKACVRAACVASMMATNCATIVAPSGVPYGVRRRRTWWRV